MEIPRYSCAQSELYACLRNGWSHYQKHQPTLGIFSPQFTVKFGEDALKEVETAEALPDREARNSTYQLLRLELVTQMLSCTSLWKFLKAYITYAFPKGTQEIHWKSAGWKYYDAATSENWPGLNNLMSSGMRFIDNNLPTLLANNNMPTDFPSKFSDAKDTFIKTYNDFINAELDSQTLTGEKIVANNACHEKLMNMFAVAVEVFADDEEVRKQFIFSEILQKVAGTGTAGFSGKVLNAITNLPEKGVAVNLLNRKEKALTDTEGRYSILQIAEGTYQLMFSKTGFAPLTLIAEAPTGIVKPLDPVLLNPLDTDAGA